MGMFEKFRKPDVKDIRDLFMESLRKLLAKENLPVDNELITKVVDEIPRIKIYGCANNCPNVVYLSEVIPDICPTCGQLLKQIEASGRLLKATQEINKEFLAKAHLHYAIGCLEKDDPRSAEAVFTQVIELQPENMDAYYNRSQARRTLGDYMGAIDDANQVIQHNPKDADAYLHRGAAKAQQGDYEGGIADTTKAINLGSAKKYAYFNRGMCYLNLKKTREAVADLKHFLEIAPSDPRVPIVRKLLNM